MNPNSQNGPELTDNQKSMNLFVTICHIYSTSVEVFMRRGFGERYLGAQALFALFLIPLHMSFMQTEDPILIGATMLGYVGACIGHRGVTQARRRIGEIEHTYYDGWPIALGKKTTINEQDWKAWGDPIIIVLVGIFFAFADRGFGSFFITAGVAMFIKNHLIHQLHSAKVKDLYDNMIEQKQLAARFRQMNEDRSTFPWQ